MAVSQRRLHSVSRPTDHLTPRELQVLALVADGRTTKAVARALGITFKTAVSHRQNIMNKLDVRNTALLIRAAIRNGLIEA